MATKNEIDALVSLLDDPDEIIFNQIKSQLLELGTDCIAHLEKANFENDYGPIFKSRINGITHEIWAGFSSPQGALKFLSGMYGSDEFAKFSPQASKYSKFKRSYMEVSMKQYNPD